ncbi:MAG: esterase, partial [Polaromonas sp.]
MTKTFSKLWLRSLRRMGRAQQTQGRLLLESILPKAVKRARPLLVKPTKALKKTPALSRATVTKPRAKAVQRIRPPAAPVQCAVPALPGVWQKFWFSAPGKSKPSQAGSAGRMLYWL